MLERERQTLGDRYELTAVIATGGMGQVWRARDTLLGRPVAVKVLRSEFTGDPTFLARFRAEAQHTAVLAHPHIAALYDYGEVVAAGSGEHLAYLVMELVEGEPLSALLAREHHLDPDRTLHIVRQTAAALAVAHDAGVIHRDVKPGNVLVGAGDRVKITDFGIAWSAASVPLTQTGQVVGTAQYLSPEQAEGRQAGPASDVYALGMVAYECLAGRRAFDGENSVTIALKQIREEPAPLPATLPAGVRGLVERALVKDPDRRIPDGAALRDAVDAVRAGRPLPAASTAALPVIVADPPFPPPRAGWPRPVLGSVRRSAAGDRLRSGRVLVPLLALVTGAAIAVGVLHVTSQPTSPSAAAGTPAAAVIELAAASFLGRPVADVQADLLGLGLQVQLRPIQTIDVAPGQVLALDPVGGLVAGDMVTVSHAVAPATPQPVVVAPAGQAAAPPPAAPADQSDGDGDGASESDGQSDGDNNRDNNGNGNGNGRDGNGRDGD